MSQHLRRDLLAADVASVPTSLPEAGLLERIRAGDEAAFEELFQEYYRGLCDFVHGYVRSRETAEELVQTIFLRVWEKHETWAPAVGARAYLFAASRNAALDHLRHERVVDRAAAPCAWAGSGDRNPGGGAQPPGSEEAVEASELTEALIRAVRDLPERRRSVVILRWQHQLTNVEIARALGISIKGVEGHVTRALAALRERLGPFRP